MNHPASTSLRAIADWLDQHGENVKDNIGIYAWLRNETPASFRAIRAVLPEHKITAESSAIPSLHAEFDGAYFSIAFCKERVSEVRTVTREVTEYTLPECP